MRTLVGIGAIALGVLGMLLCAAAVGVGWWAGVRISARLDRAAARLDHGLSEVDLHLSRVEARMTALRSNLSAVREAVEAIAEESPELPRVRAVIDRALNRLVPTFDRAEALAESLQSAAATLRTVADIVDELKDDSEATVRVREAADKIERGAERLNGLRPRVEALKVAKGIHFTRELVDLAREALAGSELLAEGVVAARQQIAGLRARTVESRDELVFWTYVAATAHAVVWLWGGLGQLCLIGWGRRFNNRTVAA